MKQALHWSVRHRLALFIVFALTGLAAVLMTTRLSIAEGGMTFPFYPSFIQVETKTPGEQPVPENWQDPEVCAGCHERQYEG